MRIALIAPPWVAVPPPAYGGTEQILDVLARGLLARGHDVLLFTTGDSTCPVPRSGVYPAAEKFRMGCSIPELCHVIHAYEAVEGYEIVHDHTTLGPFIAAGRGDRRVVTTNHGPFTPEVEDIYRTIDDRVAIVAISHDQAGRAKDVRIARVIHHGLDPDDYRVGRGTGGYLLFLGRMAPEKGPHRAARIARRAGRRLVIAAKMDEPAEHEYYEAKVEPLLGDDVVHVGEADREMKARLLENATALINPIRWAEPFGLVMIEALACGTPVLTFAEGAAGEIVEDGINGFICADEAAMAAAIGRLDDIDRATCRRSFERRFTAARMVEEHLGLYREVAAGAAPRGGDELDPLAVPADHLHPAREPDHRAAAVLEVDPHP